MERAAQRTLGSGSQRVIWEGAMTLLQAAWLYKLAMVAGVCNPSNQKVEAVGSAIQGYTVPGGGGAHL